MRDKQYTYPGVAVDLLGTGEIKEISRLADAGKKSDSANPFLDSYHTPYNVPPFDKIKPGHFIPALKEGICRQQQEIGVIVDNPAPPDFANTLEALESSGALLREIKNVTEVFRTSCADEKMQKVIGEVSALLAGQQDEIRFNSKLFQKVKVVYEKKERLNLTEEQRMLLEDYYKEFTRGGISLSPGGQARLREINCRLSRLLVRFENNILKETRDFRLVIEDPGELAGLPAGVIQAAAETAEKQGDKGKWVFTLHNPSLMPVLQYSPRRRLRETLFNAYISRGNRGNRFDNKAVLLQIVSLRAERARLLGYANHAEYMLEKNMARNPQKVCDFLGKLWKPFLEKAKKEAKALQALIDKEEGNVELQPWDWWYYAEKLKQETCRLDERILCHYFPLENVLEGVFYTARKLYGLKFRELTDVPKYRQEIRGFEVREADGSHLGILYFDFFPRVNKQVGSLMNPLRKQSRRGERRIFPVVTNHFNFPAPTKHQPSLLSIEDVRTLFHEFGHALHGLLSDCTYERLSGTSVPLDFLELPSQVMENWALEPEVLEVYARHYRTGERIPGEWVERIGEARLLNNGFTMVEYLAAAFLDLDWHRLEHPVEAEVETFEALSLAKTGLIPGIGVRYRSTYFGHIFGGGYSAGYYSYLWAEVLDADAFAAFKRAGLFDREVARAFRAQILEKGGTAEPMTLYRRFRGAEPDIQHLLKRNQLFLNMPEGQ
jgi:peptidyl-dipeptidase Dcp